MKSVNPKLLVFLVLAIVLVGLLKVMNPYRKYSSRAYWETATITEVADIPAEALKPGNKNGGVLMWAAMASKDPAILKALVNRGADINESDGVFMGTPLTGAAGYTSSTKILDELINLGADITKRVNNQETALMIAAQYNKNPGIIEKLVSLGANINNKNSQGKTALYLAKKNKNNIAIEALETLERS